MHLKSENCVGGKCSKVRLTGLAAANAAGEKLTTHVCDRQVTKTKVFYWSVKFAMQASGTE